MKTDLKPILAAILKERGEIRIKPKHDNATTIIDQHVLREFDEISFDSDWVKTARDAGGAVYFSPVHGTCEHGINRDDNNCRVCDP